MSTPKRSAAKSINSYRTGVCRNIVLCRDEFGLVLRDLRQLQNREPSRRKVFDGDRKKRGGKGEQQEEGPMLQELLQTTEAYKISFS